MGRPTLARRLLDRPWLILRGADGVAVLLEDRCPHRFAPLSKGTVHGDAVECLYHGLRFDASGACVEIPGQANIPTQARVRLNRSRARSEDTTPDRHGSSASATR